VGKHDQKEETVNLQIQKNTAYLTGTHAPEDTGKQHRALGRAGNRSRKARKGRKHEKPC
jgi:hypothetical protein